MRQTIHNQIFERAIGIAANANGALRGMSLWSFSYLHEFLTNGELSSSQRVGAVTEVAIVSVDRSAQVLK